MKLYPVLLVFLSAFCQLGSSCKDEYTGVEGCSSFLEWRSCDNDWMQKYCKKSCNACPESTCKDEYEEECPSWKSDCTEGEYKDWMEEYCKKTCNVCADTTVITTEPTVTTVAPPKGECGIENKPMTRIQGGTETAPNQFPWMVRLPMGCGGSFITDRHILTAYHCLEGETDWRGEKVKYSVHNQHDENDYEEGTIKDYVWPKLDEWQDIAIVTLEKAVDLSDKTIGTVCLPKSADEDYTGKQALAMGWGWNPVPQGQSDKLFKVGLKVDYEDGIWLFTKTVMMNGKPVDVCRGDSGGPLVYNKGGRWTIIGTVQGGEYCDSKNHGYSSGLWNRVTAHLKWINTVIGV